MRTSSTHPSRRASLLATAAVLALSLSACSTRSIKHEVVPSEKPLPPRVDCNQPSAEDPPPHPRTDDIVAWTTWAARAYGVIRGERDLDAIEEACIADLKSKGVIR